MKYIVTLLILGQILMAATIEYIETNSSKVPVVYESDTRLPLVTMQFTFTNSGSVTDLKKSRIGTIQCKGYERGHQNTRKCSFCRSS